MYGDYLVMCGMVWAQFGKQDAGFELIRALDSPDQNVRVLARILLDQATEGSKELIGEALALDEISVGMAQLCGFEQNHRSKLKDPTASAWWHRLQHRELAKTATRLTLRHFPSAGRSRRNLPTS
jgi:hypothetical protein